MYAAFVDVMGVQRALLGEGRDDPESVQAFEDCRENLESFHRDLDNLMERELELLLHDSQIPQPNFVAEFSDSAYIVGDHFASVAVPALSLMRKALRHEYPLRGGIGIGTFAHETSGVRTNRQRQIWSTSSFLGSSVVTAYQAERCPIAGLRVFIHPDVMILNTEAYLDLYTMPVREPKTQTATHELRIWRAYESSAAIKRLIAFREKKGQLPERATQHYDATITAYENFETVETELPHIVPALWL